MNAYTKNYNMVLMGDCFLPFMPHTLLKRHSDTNAT